MKKLLIMMIVLLSIMLVMSFCNPPVDGGDSGDGGDAGDVEYWIKSIETTDSIKLCYNSEVTSDGYYLNLVSTANYDADGKLHYQVFKFDTAGDIIWQKKYEAPDNDNGSNAVIMETSDGKYLIAGQTASYGLGSKDAWLIKLDTDGSIIWQKCYGGQYEEFFYDIKETSDNGLIMAGKFGTYNGLDYLHNLWVVKMDSSGNIEWEKMIEDAATQIGQSVIETSDGDFIVTADHYPDPSNNDTLIIKFDSSGNIIWQKIYSTTEIYAYILSITETSDGNFIMVGGTTEGNGSFDVLVIKMDTDGVIMWQNAYGGSGYENARLVVETVDGNYLIGGQTDSYSVGDRDFWYLKLDDAGDIISQKTFGGVLYDSVYGLKEINSNGDLLMTGQVESWVAGGRSLGYLVMPADGFEESQDFVTISAGNKVATALNVTNSSYVVTDTTATITDTTASVVDTSDTVNDIYP